MKWLTIMMLVTGKKAMNVLDRKDTPGPVLDDWKEQKAFKHDLNQTSRRLATALKMGVKDTLPEAMAEAVVADCWVEQAKEGWQYEHIKTPYRFEMAMDLIQEKVGHHHR